MYSAVAVGISVVEFLGCPHSESQMCIRIQDEEGKETQSQIDFLKNNTI